MQYRVSQEQEWGLFVRCDGDKYEFVMLTDMNPSITERVSFYGPFIETKARNIDHLKRNLEKGVLDNLVAGKVHSIEQSHSCVTIGEFRKRGVKFVERKMGL